VSPLEFDPPLDPTPTINVALLGPPKTGKTAGAASAPGPVLYLNADTPGRMRYMRKKYGDKVSVVTFKYVKGERSPHQTLVDAAFAAYSGEWKTVVLDPVADIYKEMVLERFEGEVPETMSKPALNQFRVVQDELIRFCTALCKAPVNFVMVFHDSPEKDESTGEVERVADAGPSKPKLGRSLLAKVDIVGYTLAVERDGGINYVAQLAPVNGRPGGDGFNCLLEPGKLARKLDLTEWVEVIAASEAEPTTNEE